MKRETFTDFDAFRATNPQLDGQWLLNGGRDYRWNADSLTAGDCGLLRCYSNTGLIIEGAESMDCYHFYVPFKAGWRNNGVGFNDDEILVFEPGTEHCCDSKSDDGWLGFLVPKHLVSIDPGTQSDRARHSYTVKTDPMRTETIRNLFRKVIAAVAENPESESSPAAKMVEAELQSLLLPILEADINGDENKARNQTGRPRISRLEILQRSRAILEEQDIDAIHVSELATQVGVSERSLRSVFNEYYQIGPRQYLLLRQLHKVRRDLIAADPEETTVTSVLTHWGVWNFGRFSGKYKSQFGELPSETLRGTSLVSPDSAPMG